MSTQTLGTDPRTLATPPPWLRVVFRAPALVYEHGLGRLLGRRFLALTHVGRRTGRRYRTVLEVVEIDPHGPELFVVSGFGEETDWLRNLRAAGGGEVTVSRWTFPATCRDVAADEAAGVFAHYEERNRFAGPLLRMILSRLLGWRYDGSPADRMRLAHQLPMVALRPADGAALR
jgi:deazaflavin-dependent oxidoreductase (nitroreductase family)